MKVTQSCSTLWDPMDYSSPKSSVHGDSPGKNTRVSYHALLQGYLPNPGIEPRSPTLQVDSLLSEPPRKLIYTRTHTHPPACAWLFCTPVWMLSGRRWHTMRFNPESHSCSFLFFSWLWPFSEFSLRGYLDSIQMPVLLQSFAIAFFFF